ncbi:MAG TPA: SRPBCC domain-containing protein [Bacteroidia bacterium]|jgi:uncharacterized protein YndB with AHSA1/START domain|nr:SRPBCC domain-containing protein [Bacteroidia bacterium]
MAFDKTINKTIEINAPVSNVWDALTNPGLMQLWLWEGVNVISDWKAGSLITFKGTYNGYNYEDKGTILKLEKEKVFQYNYWGRLSQLPDLPENYTIIEFMLTTGENKTLLKLTQGNCITYEVYAHWNFYWTVTLDILKKLLEK